MFIGLERQYKVCNFGMKTEIQWSLKRCGEVHWSLRQGERPAGYSSIPVSSSCVFSSRHTISQKGSPPQKKDMCELYSYYTQSSPSKNKYINYIFIYLLVFRYLSSGQCSTVLLQILSSLARVCYVLNKSENWIPMRITANISKVSKDD